MLSGLKTERQNRASSDLDKMSAMEIATLMNRQDARVLRAVRHALDLFLYGRHQSLVQRQDWYVILPFN